MNHINVRNGCWQLHYYSIIQDLFSVTNFSMKSQQCITNCICKELFSFLTYMHKIFDDYVSLKTTYFYLIHNLKFLILYGCLLSV
jgi:hypothetical protein